MRGKPFTDAADRRRLTVDDLSCRGVLALRVPAGGEADSEGADKGAEGDSDQGGEHGHELNASRVKQPLSVPERRLDIGKRGHVNRVEDCNERRTRKHATADAESKDWCVVRPRVRAGEMEDPELTIEASQRIP